MSLTLLLTAFDGCWGQTLWRHKDLMWVVGETIGLMWQSLCLYYDPFFGGGLGVMGQAAVLLLPRKPTQNPVSYLLLLCLSFRFFLGTWNMSGFLSENRPIRTLREILTRLRETYCGNIGFEVGGCVVTARTCLGVGLCVLARCAICELWACACVCACVHGKWGGGGEGLDVGSW